MLAVWCINAGAFFLAELLTAPTPATSEPAGVLLAALAGQLALGAGGALAAGALGSGLPHAWLAFLPGLGLLAPRVAFTLRAAPAEALPLLAAAAVTTGGLALAWRRSRGSGAARHAAYAVGALAVWSILLLLKNVAADVPLTAEPIATNLRVVHRVVPVLALLGLAAALAASRRPGLVAPLAAAAALAVAGRFAAPAALRPPPAAEARAAGAAARTVPVVLIVMDTARMDHLSLYGYPRDTTPELAAFARDAEVFENAVSNSSWTLPAHASLFTGLFPLRHGADRPYWLAGAGDPGTLRPGLPLTEDHVTLAEWLHGHGYETAAVASNFGYLDPAFGLGQGFAFYDAAPNTPVKPLLLSIVHRRVVELPWAAQHWRMYRTAEQVNQVAFEWLRARRSDAIFLFLNYMEPHRNWTAPGLRHEEFAAERDDPRSKLRPGPLASGLRRVVDLYDSQLAALDRSLGALFAELRRLGLYDRALIVVTADHGESFGEHDVVGHGKSVYAAEVAIPLLVKRPGARGGVRRSERVQLIDILPTIAATLGLPAPHGVEGDPVGAIRHPILAEFYTDPRAAEDVARGYQAAVYDGALKVLVGDHLTGVFDLLRDPAETRRLPLGSDELSSRQAWITTRRQTLEASLRARTTPVAPLDPGVERALRALGYVDDRAP